MKYQFDRKHIAIRKVCFTDKDLRKRIGYVNKQIYRFWETEKSHFWIYKPLHSKRIIVWCAKNVEGIRALYFTEEHKTLDL